MTKINIKNMVCPRCIDSVRGIFRELKISVANIQLGEVDVVNNLSSNQKSELRVKLKERGFELLEDQKSKTIDAIKSIIIKQIHHATEALIINFSTHLAEKLNQEYSSLSKLFSSVEGVTIEKYILHQKIEKVKELIHYNQLTLSEIAFQLNYSSVAHLSSQFKKETGMTPTAFKKLNINNRKNLDEV